MKIPQVYIALLASASLSVATSLNALTTDPLGYVTVEVNDGADRKVGVPLTQAPVLVASVSSVAVGTVSTVATVPDVTTDAHFVWFTSGALLGQWYQITDSTSSSFTVTEDLDTAGLSSADTFKILPFWTLSTLLTGQVPASANPSAPSALVLVNDLSAQGINLASGASYFYFDNGTAATGWYQLGNTSAGKQDTLVLSPESYITVRNSTGAVIDVVLSGNVPTHTIANDVAQLLTTVQDNLISNPFPEGMSLANSGLVQDGVIVASPNPSSPTDLLLVYDSVPTAINPAADKTFFYFDNGTTATGWYQLGNTSAGKQDDFVIPGGGAIVVRKGAGANAVTTWTPDMPYSL